MKDMELEAETLYKHEVRSIDIIIYIKKKKNVKVDRNNILSPYLKMILCKVVCFPISCEIYTVGSQLSKLQLSERVSYPNTQYSIVQYVN